VVVGAVVMQIIPYHLIKKDKTVEVDHFGRKHLTLQPQDQVVAVVGHVKTYLTLPLPEMVGYMALVVVHTMDIFSLEQ
jgi:hypothetical protein